MRRKSFADHPFDLDDLKKLINALAACPHAPADVKPTLMKMLDDAFEAQLPVINAMADNRLLESLKGKKMAQNARHINAFNRRKFDKRIHNWLGDKYNIHAIRYGSEWHHTDEHRRVGDTLKYIKEDYTHINVYTDPDEGRPFYECHLRDGVKDLRRGVKRHVRWAHGPYSCSAVPKTP